MEPSERSAVIIIDTSMLVDALAGPRLEDHRVDPASAHQVGEQQTGRASLRDVVKLDLPPGQDLAGALRAAGVSADGAARVAADELAEETDLTLRPAAELARSNPALLAKIVGVLREALTPAEQHPAPGASNAAARATG